MSQVDRHDTMHARCAPVTARQARSRISCAVLLTLVAATIGLATGAQADIIQIPAITFANRLSATAIGDSNFGTLTNATGTFFAPVPFPVDRERVCLFTLVHRDNDSDFGITAKLLKKRIVIGDNPFTPPTVMAQVATGVTAATAGVNKKSDNTIRRPVIDLANAFYYVELTIPATTLEVLGVQVDVRPAC